MKTLTRFLLIGCFGIFSAHECLAEGYLFGDVGYSKDFYGNNPSVQNFVGTQLPNSTSHLPIAFDLGGMFKLMPHFTLGLAWDASYDYYYQNKSNTQAGAVVQNSLVFTTRQFLGQDFGHGLYTRFDAGLGWLSTTGNVYSTSSASPNSQGLYLLAGAGWAFALPSSVAICVEVDGSRLFLGGGAVYTIQPKIGLSFSFGGK